MPALQVFDESVASRHARRDAKLKRRDHDGFITARLGSPPKVDHPHGIAGLDASLSTLRLTETVINEQRKHVFRRVPSVRRYRWRLFAAAIVAAIEWIGATYVFVEEVGMLLLPGIIAGFGFTLAAIFCTRKVREAIEEDEWHWTHRVALIAYILLCASVGYLRYAAQSNGDVTVAYAVALSVIVAVVTIIPGVIVDALMREHEKTRPAIIELNELNSELRSTQCEATAITKVKRRIDAFDARKARLQAIYTTAYERELARHNP